MPTKEELYDGALSHFAENDLEAAVNAFKKLVETYPDYIEGFLGLGHAYERLVSMMKLLMRFRRRLKLTRRIRLYIPVYLCVTNAKG